MNAHIEQLVQKSSSELFALKTLRNHGLSRDALNNVCNVTIIARFLYASPAWRGFCNSSQFTRLESVCRRAMKWGFRNESSPSLSSLMDRADASLFSSVIQKQDHVLQTLLPPQRSSRYHMRDRGHNYVLPVKTSNTAQNFLIRLLYSNI